MKLEWLNLISRSTQGMNLPNGILINTYTETGLHGGLSEAMVFIPGLKIVEVTPVDGMQKYEVERA